MLSPNKSNDDKVQNPFGHLSSAENAPNQTDAMIASAFKNMSMQERERNYSEMHGVADIIEETPAFLDTCLRDLEQQVLQLIRIKPKLAKAYLVAYHQDPQYVHNRLLRTRFLRSEDFIPKRSASRMIRWFDWKRNLFGDQKLCKEIGYDDLMPEDIVMLRKGYFQWLPERDRAGRIVFVAILANQVFKSPESLGRVLFYMSVQRREEPCEMGEIALAMYTEQPSMATLDLKLTAMYAQASDATPARHLAFHHCISDSSSIFFKMFLGTLLKDVEAQSCAKVKIHCGSFQEHMYSLMTYGIPHRAIPLRENGSIKTKAHLEWLEMRKVREKMSAEGRRDMIDLPLHSDVLLGRGKPIQEHMGNLRLQAIVDEYISIYFQSTKKAKTALAVEIVKRVKNEAECRFLSKEEGIWLEVPDAVAQEKVSKLFRTRKDLAPSTTVDAGQRNPRRNKPGDMPSNSRTPEVEAEMERFGQQPAAKRWRM